MVSALSLSVLVASFDSLSAITFATIALVAVPALQLLTGTGSYFPVRSLIALTAAVQWCLAPLLYYRGAYDHFKYYQYVSELDYYALAIPGTAALLAGLFLGAGRHGDFREHQAISEVEILLKRFSWLPIAFIALGVLSSFAQGALPPSFAFVGYLFSQLRFVGIILLIISERRDRFIILSVLAIVTIVQAAATSLFHDVFLWSIFIGTFISRRYRLSTPVKCTFAIGLIISALIVQNVKLEFRQQTWGDSSGQTSVLERADLFARTFAAGGKSIFSEQGGVRPAVGQTVMRLNQGWIISRVMATVPSVEPYARGETILNGIVASVLPRALVPNKSAAGGKQNYERFTGFALTNTSMGISILGEGYANWGIAGAVAFLAVYGLSISLMLRVLLLSSGRNALLVIFVPAIFLHVLKAETEFLTVANYLIKAVALYFVATLVFYKWIKGSSNASLPRRQ